jgi:hypothetical protein
MLLTSKGEGTFLGKKNYTPERKKCSSADVNGPPPL